MINHLNRIIGLKNKNNTGITHLSTVLNLKSINSTPPTPPASGTPIKMIGGKSVIFNQLASSTSSDWKKRNASLSVSGKTLTISASSTSTSTLKRVYLNLTKNHKFLVYAVIETGDLIYATIGMFNNESLDSTDYNKKFVVNPNKTETINSIFESTDVYSRLGFTHAKSATTGKYFTSTNTQIFDLTLMFGSGNEPSTPEAFEAMFPNDYYSYSTGTLLSGKCDSVVSYDDQSTQIDEYLIPAEVQALSGYGLSTRSLYNYIDFENKKFVQNVDIRAYQSGDESDSTLLTDETNTVYPITPVETDISSYVSTIPTISTVEGGSIVLHQQSDTKLDIPYTISDE